MNGGNQPKGWLSLVLVASVLLLYPLLGPIVDLLAREFHFSDCEVIGFSPSYASDHTTYCAAVERASSTGIVMEERTTDSGRSWQQPQEPDWPHWATTRI